MAYPFIASRWFEHSDARSVDLIVMHTAETPEGEDTAPAVARYFAGLPSSHKASAHYVVDGGLEDADAIIQCVQERDVAFAAPGANHNGVQIELAGRAGQGAQGWADAYSQRALHRAAVLVAAIAKRHAIPIARLNATSLKQGRTGICGHHDVTLAFHKSTHTDPGPDFPWSAFIDMVRSAAMPSPSPKKVIVNGHVRTLVAPNGGYWHIQPDGGVVTAPNGAGSPEAPFYGSVPGVQGGMPLGSKAVDGAPFGDGYAVIVQHADRSVTAYHFPAA